LKIFALREYAYAARFQSTGRENIKKNVLSGFKVYVQQGNDKKVFTAKILKGKL